MSRIIFRWIKVLLVIYLLTGIALYFLQDFILFHPTPFARNHQYDFSYIHRDINMRYDSETNLNVIEFKTPDSGSRGVVLYFHGNRKNISWYAQYAPNFTRDGYEVWMLDYPGFGKSTGKFSEQRLYDYALQVYKLARIRFKPNHIIIYGKSMGTGIAAELAAVRDCRRLILETPYYSVESIVSHYIPIYPVNQMLHYHMPTYDYLPLVTAPVTIFHGTKDGVIPYPNAERLKPLMKAEDEFVTITDGEHNNLNSFPLFHAKLDSVLAK